MSKLQRLFLLAYLFALVCSCTGIPDGVTPVKNFDNEKFLGTWYEIARLDHSFEEGLSKVTAQYRSKEGGGISVTNRGYSEEKGKWKEALGKAYFVQEKNVGYLKVSFFGPFYGSYVIFEVDEDEYQYAFVTSYTKEYLWLLSRTPEIDNSLKQRFLDTAKQYNFDTTQLIWVSH